MINRRALLRLGLGLPFTNTALRRAAAEPSTEFDQYYILDSDLGGDPDDAAAAIILLNHLNDNPNETLIAACSVHGGTSPCPADYEAPGFKAFLDVYGYGHLPFGCYHGPNSEPFSAWEGGVPTILDTGFRARRAIADIFGRAGQTRADFPSSVSVLRTALAEAPDDSVTYIALGGFQNVYDLMVSDMGGITGAELMTQKLKRIVCVVHNVPEGTAIYNTKVTPNASRHVVNNWAADVPGVPFDMVDKHETFQVMSGPPDSWSKHIHPCKAAFEMRDGNVAVDANGEKASIDAHIVLFAINPGHSAFGGWHMQNGTFALGDDPDVTPIETPDEPGPFSIVRLTASASSMRTTLNELIAAMPDPVPTGMFKPVALSPRIHLDAADAAWSDGNLVAWDNDKGWDGVLAGATGIISGKPTKGDVLNGIATVRFDDDAHGVQFEVEAWHVNGMKALTYCWFGKLLADEPHTSQGLFNKGWFDATSEAGGPFMCAINGDSATPGQATQRAVEEPGGPRCSAPDLTDTSDFQCQIVSLGAAVTARRNGVSITVSLANTSTGDVPGHPAATLVVGRGRDFPRPAESANCDFRHLYIFDWALTTEDRRRLEGYIFHNAGLGVRLPANHPYREAPPTGWY